MLLRAVERAAARLDAHPCSPVSVARAAIYGRCGVASSTAGARLPSDVPSDVPADGYLVEAGRAPAPCDDVSGSDDVSDWLESMDRMANPWWMPVAVLLDSHARLGSVVHDVRMAWQRLSRGWDESDVYGLHVSLPLRLADQLDELARTSSGWPRSAEFPHAEDWRAALHATACDLRRARVTPAARRAREAWQELAFGADADEELEHFAWAEMKRVDEEDRAAARRGMLWVADHLPDLWD